LDDEPVFKEALLMAGHLQDEEPPGSTDAEGWRRCIENDKLTSQRMEDVVAAIQDMLLTGDEGLLNTLVLHVSDAITRILRRRIPSSFPNNGDDIVDDAHGQLIEALLQPHSADGKGLRKAFVPRIEFRAIDALRRARPAEENEEQHEDFSEVLDAQLGRAKREVQNLEEERHVESVLALIPDDEKRMAFRLHMQGIPLKSKRTVSISSLLRKDPSTVKIWIEEVQAQLKLAIGDTV